ncbi:MAG: thiamine biosynthesis protein ThiH [Candidatus Lambdaproteobacteria bacterium RIFOXYD1_FULL_56_27]|uniref:Thiamine biosynthesis protein ThiH n=1 Tax=Candidatus Lambdaproteobacteria bacterium RIFOXYD2_FULL_56_26 TaxID=1817773 RepID=A0A1F6GL36_9PROT|nr:MAG: thiamine biosynthesis protein ThiH [Candidatus Lambdaproteobacteria bacterium RIFOXYD2_FULL_56_26]OGH04230.1 MAG: thiamine biosynthesis protein ThiH [Candidatus Lambdaproteobacteria bacterium RIFOXYC1_FULL_56_13]OGH08872.1 MAG: thiamine biosynthesis protein ThiH [Candidatus Lambdaproteobacteria bacterium RIFOXYD1_FULL_56_27]
MNQTNRETNRLQGFAEVFARYDWQETQRRIQDTTPAEVERVLQRAGSLSPLDFLALVSPAAQGYLEEMARISQALTRRRFGKTVQLYAPLYLSNECLNSCLYCGFSREIQRPRVRLTQEQTLAEVAVLKELGIEHVLLVTGDFSHQAGNQYLNQALEWVRPHFAQVSMEVQPLAQAEYQALADRGLHGVMVYQETYGPNYTQFHPKGSKKDFFWRLGTPDRLGAAGVHKIGLGVLLGLEDWRTDSFFVALQVAYLEKHYWRSRISISFPRLRPAEVGFSPPHPVCDSALVQLVLAYRIFNENLELSLSTRESARLRDALVPLGITSLSAGSKTEPGGYANPKAALEQFEINDGRSPKEMALALAQSGLDLIVRDWDPHFGLDPNFGT